MRINLREEAAKLRAASGASGELAKGSCPRRELSTSGPIA